MRQSRCACSPSGSRSLKAARRVGAEEDSDRQQITDDATASSRRTYLATRPRLDVRWARRITPMIVIFASSWDESAATLAARWASHHASLLTSDDLSRAGWRHHLGSPETSTAVVAGRIVPVQEITGVLIRWPGVFAPELTQIVETDRDYVAEEMRAFLFPGSQPQMSRRQSTDSAQSHRACLAARTVDACCGTAWIPSQRSTAESSKDQESIEQRRSRRARRR